MSSTTGVVGVNGYDYNQPPPRDFEIDTGRRLPARQMSNGYERDMARGPPLTKSHTFDQPQGVPEMPNFDAIAPNVSETLTGPKAVQAPAYAKKSYADLAVDTNASRGAPPQSSDSPLADFTFNLPQSNSAPPAMHEQIQAGRGPSQMRNNGPGGYREPNTNIDDPPFDYNNPPLSPPVPNSSRGGYDPRVAPNGMSKAPNSQFPPRSVSRPDPAANLPRQGSDPYAQQHQDSGYWGGSPEHKPTRPDAGNGRGAQQYDRAGSSESAQAYAYNQGYDDRGQDPSYAQQYGQDAYHNGYDARQPPRQSNDHTFAQAPPPRPHTSNSAHPAPVRNYGGMPGNEGFRPDVPPSAGSGFDRPPPIRPGLLGNQPLPQQAPRRGPTPMQQATQQPPPQPPYPHAQQQAVQQPVVQQTPQPRNNSMSQRNSSGSESEKPPVTIAELNQMREQFKDKPNDFSLGMKFAKRLVDAAKTLSNEGGRADPKQTARNRERYINDAHKVVKKMVNAGSTEAMFYLADSYGQGSLGLPVDPKEAFHLYQSAAKMNHPQSAYRVAVCCELGNEDGGGTRRDPMKAIQWYKRAATLGDTPAMYKMGMILLKGLLGQQRDARQAVSWLKRAAERADKENPHALHELGLLYESAKPEDHILRDEPYAYQLFHQAAELGYKYSQFRLGSAFEYGALGCPIDQRQSIGWYSRAAAQGEHQSELALSGWYLTGASDLVKQNDQEAFLWARKAASSGLAKAEFAMGYYCEMGIGTNADVEEAKRWYYRAAGKSDISTPRDVC
jgi:TPR repeat protein